MASKPTAAVLRPGSLKPKDLQYVGNPQVGEQLKVVKLLAQISASDRARIGGLVECKAFKPGHEIIKEGAVISGLYMIQAGSAKVQKRDAFTRVRSVRALLGVGDHFGEAAQLENPARGASVTADGPSDLKIWYLPTERLTDLFAVLNQDDGRKRAISAEAPLRSAQTPNRSSIPYPKGSIVYRSRGSIAAMDYKELINAADTKKDSEKVPTVPKDLLFGALNSCGLFMGLRKHLKEKIVDGMWRLQVPKGVRVVSQGDLGDPHLYVIEKGTVSVFARGSLKATERGPGMLFGELQMLHDAERHETVTATGNLNLLWAIDRASFRNIAAEDAALMASYLSELLDDIQDLDRLSRSELEELSHIFRREEYEAGTIIVQEGQRVDAVHVLLEGELDSGFAGSHETLRSGAFFCLLPTFLETEVDMDTAFLPQISCRTNVSGLKLDDVELARTCMRRFLSKRGTEYKQERRASRKPSSPQNKTPGRGTQTPQKSSQKSSQKTTPASAKAGGRTPGPGTILEIPEDGDDDDEEGDAVPDIDTPIARHKHTHIAPKTENGVLPWPAGKGPVAIPRESLKRMAFLGKGSYGHVELVRHTPTGRTFALKAVMKKEVVDCNQLGHIVNEKRVMMSFNSPFLVQLYSTYRDADCVYFLLEPALGGELFNVLRAHSILDNQKATFYAASVVLGLEHMHERGVVYRDLKPENILLDNRGFAKIADFGFAKQLTAAESFRTFTLCGTPDYLAPEVLLGSGHSFGFDWWCMGVFIYELLAGVPPFSNANHDVVKTYEDILAGNMKFPPFLTKEANMIISDFMQYNATDRLGVIKGGTKLIFQHPWFHGFDWDGLRKRAIEPPIKLKIKNDCDVSNFDQPEDPKELFLNPMKYTARDDDWIWEREF